MVHLFLHLKKLLSGQRQRFQNDRVAVMSVQSQTASFYDTVHGRLARWRKWRTYDVGEAKEWLENELWRRWSDVKGWRMSCDVGKATEGLENELWRRWSDGKFGEWAELIVIVIAELILQPFFRFSYVTCSSLTSPGEPPMTQWYKSWSHGMTNISIPGGEYVEK